MIVPSVWTICEMAGKIGTIRAIHGNQPRRTIPVGGRCGRCQRLRDRLYLCFLRSRIASDILPESCIFNNISTSDRFSSHWIYISFSVFLSLCLLQIHVRSHFKMLVHHSDNCIFYLNRLSHFMFLKTIQNDVGLLDRATGIVALRRT